MNEQKLSKTMDAKFFQELNKSTILNSIFNVSAMITILVFSFVRTFYIDSTFGAGALGLLSIALGILPYVSNTHGGIKSISTWRLYKPYNDGDYMRVNHVMSDIKHQYRKMGGIYLLVILAIAFAFPFIISNSTSDPWYLGTLLILSNCVEVMVTYFYVPIIILLLYVKKQAYYANALSIFLTIIFNVAIILMFEFLADQLNPIIFLTIITAILGFKVFILIFIFNRLKFKIAPWYSNTKHVDNAYCKEKWMAMLTMFLDQFGTDVSTITFMIYVSVRPQTKDDGNGALDYGNLDIAGLYAAYYLIGTSLTQICHTILDAPVPSIGELARNHKKMPYDFFDKYRSFAYIVAIFSFVSYLTVAPLAANILLAQPEFSLVLALGLGIPIFFENLTVVYTHTLPAFGRFSDNCKYSGYKAITNLCFTAFFCLIFSTATNLGDSGILLGIVLGWTVSSITKYVLLFNYGRRTLVEGKATKSMLNRWISIITIPVIIFITMAIVYNVSPPLMSYKMPNGKDGMRLSLTNNTMFCLTFLLPPTILIVDVAWLSLSQKENFKYFYDNGKATIHIWRQERIEHRFNKKK